MEEIFECKDKNHQGKTRIVERKLLLKDPNNPESKLLKTCLDCRTVNNRIIKARAEKRKSTAAAVPSDSEFLACPGAYHVGLSQHPRNKVPRALFFMNPETCAGKKCINCVDCRNRSSKPKKEKVALLKEKKKQFEEVNSDKNIKFCPSTDHDYASDFERDKVPIEMFRKDVTDPKSALHVNCSDCRIYVHAPKAEWKLRQQAKTKEGEFCCLTCYKNKPLSERGKNIDDTGGSTCIPCKSKEKEYRANSREVLDTVLKEFIVKNGCSCDRCKKIYLVPEENKHYAVELDTFLKDGERYVTYKGKTYIVSEFIKNFDASLELRILQFDHLTEEEQRSRGLLKEDEIYVPKKDCVSQLKSEDSIRRESQKTQVICGRCHVEVTIAREKGNNTFTAIRQAKEDYVNKLKEKGCSCCGFYDPKLHRFLEFDHINPEDKVLGISPLMIYDQYPMEALVRECDESITRILCRHCHLIHTSEQIKAGVVFRNN